MATQQDLIDQSNLNAAVEREEFNLFSLLRPSVTIDGDRWCVLYGADLMTGIAGFGDTPYRAMLAFNNEWNRKVDAPRHQPKDSQ